MSVNLSVTTRAVAGALRLPALPELPVTVLMRHDPAELGAVHLVVVLDDEGDSVDLVLDRALLTAGVIEGSGEGDVQVQVVGSQVVIGMADLDLSLDLTDLADLLLGTYARFATGMERDAVLALGARVQELSLP